MNLSVLSDFELDESGARAAQNERLALHVVLEHLAEVHRRKSFSPEHKSIQDYAVKKMGYDNKSAWRRVNAMLLMVQLPEIKSSIQNGELDLSRLAMIQNHINIENEASHKKSEPDLFGKRPSAQSKMDKHKKLELVRSVIGKSKTEAMRALMEKSSAPHRMKHPDQVKPLAHDANEVRITLSDADLKTLQEIRDLLAHKNPRASLSEVISIALKEARDSLERKKSKSKIRPGAEKANQFDEKNEEDFASTRTPTAALKRYVYHRAQGKCEICGSKYGTEYDHRVPWALGGKTSLKNLRLVCRACNQREAVKIFGPYEPRTS